MPEISFSEKRYVLTVAETYISELVSIVFGQDAFEGVKQKDTISVHVAGDDFKRVTGLTKQLGTFSIFILSTFLESKTIFSNQFKDLSCNELL